MMVGPVGVDVKRLMDEMVSGTHPAPTGAAPRSARANARAAVALRRRASVLLRHVADLVEPAG